MVGKNPRTMPLEDIDLSHPGIWEANEHLPFLTRLREEAPVHYCRHSAVGPYWSIMKHGDIMAVDTSPAIYSSEPTIGIVDSVAGFRRAFLHRDGSRPGTTRSARSCSRWWRRRT